MPEHVVTTALASLLAKTAEQLLTALDEPETPVSRCSGAVRALVSEGAQYAKAGNYEEAARKFHEAADRDPSFVGARVKLIKLYKAAGQDLQALVLGGFALAIATDPQSRSEIYSYMGSISLDLFKITRSPAHGEQAVHFYRTARREKSDDIVPAWNLVDAQVTIWRDAQGLDDRQREGYLRGAEVALKETILVAHRGGPVVARYLNSVVRDAENLPHVLKERWRSELAQLQHLDKTGWADPSEDAAPATSAPTRGQFGRRQFAAAIALVGIMTVLLGGAAYEMQTHGAVGTAPALQHDAHGPAQQEADEAERPEEGGTASFGRSAKGAATPDLHIFQLQGDAIELAAVEHDWVIAGIEHDWDIA